MADGQVRIEEMYAFIQLDPADNTEGVIAFLGADSHWLPMVGADLKRVEQLRPLAHRIASQTGTPVRLIKFTTREEVEVIPP